MSEEFAEPVSGDRFTAEEASGKRLIVVPVEYIKEMAVQGGRVTDAVKVSVVDLESGNAYYGALWFAGRLVGAFKNGLGSKFVGHIGQERTGQGYMAWTFYSLTQNPEVVAMARSWLAAHPEFMERVNDFQQPGQRPAQQTWSGQIPSDRAGQPAQPPAWATGGAPVQAPAPAPQPAWISQQAPASEPAPVASPAQQETVMDRLRRQAQQQVPAGETQAAQGEAGF